MGMAPPFPPPVPPILDDFVPKAFTISNITNAFPCVVTTSVNHNYQAGLIVRITIPYTGSMDQLNGQFGLITILSPNSFSLPIDTRNYTPYVASATQSAQVIPIAEQTVTLVNPVDNIAPN